MNIPSRTVQEREIHPFHCWASMTVPGRLISTKRTESEERSTYEREIYAQNGDYSCPECEV